MPTVIADGFFWIDHGSDPSFTPGSFISFHPENLTFDDAIRDVGDISYEISFSQIDADGNPVVIRPVGPSYTPFIGPYRSYFRLRFGNIAIMAGPIVSYHVGLGDNFMSVAGKSWEHILERWQYPFNPDLPNAFISPTQTYLGNELIASGSAIPAGIAYQANNRDLILILADILTNMMNLVGHRLTFDVSLLTTTCGIRSNYQLSLGDTSTMASILGTSSGTRGSSGSTGGLSSIGNGFDWWISWDRKIYWGSPYRFGNPSAPAIEYIIDGSTAAKIPNDLAITNSGPGSTHLLATGAGLATQTTLGKALGYGAAQTEFTRLDQNYDFGDVRNPAQLTALAQKQLALDLNPQHDVPLTLDPNRIPNFWSTIRKGRAIWITYDLYAHRIDAPFQIMKIAAKPDNDGNIQADITLRQIYDTSLSAGSVEG